MAELNDETIASVLQDKENVDSLLDKSPSSSSFDTLLDISPLKCDNQRNNLTVDDGSSSDDGAVKSVRKRVKRFSDSDSEVEADKENIQNNLTPTKKAIKPHIPSESEDDMFPRKSRLLAKDSSDEDITSSKNEGVKNEQSKKRDKKIIKNRCTSPEKSKSNGSSESEDDTLPRKSRLDFSDSSDNNATSKNKSTRKSKKNELSPRKASKSNNSSDSEDDILPRKSRLVPNADSSDDNSRSSRKTNNSSKMRSPGKSNELNNSSDSEDDKIPRKSRLISNEDSSDDNIKNESARISDKRSKLHNKFKGLLNSRSKGPEPQRKSPLKSSEERDGSNSDDSGSGIESIKQKIKQRSMLLKSGICDPDTSSDEESRQVQKQRKKKPSQKSTIMISPQEKPKPARMSAKQAMENMQKIKSESNRMLREKEVSLPYHRPKALSLKDIMNRRRPALSADGKALPVKMNSDQLKQYVKLLEQRNKEMMELCKSESEEEEETNDTTTEDNKEPGPQVSAQGDKVASDENNVPQNANKSEENTVEEPVNETEETNENDLPDLTVEIVQKELDLSNANIVDSDLLNTDVGDKYMPNTDDGSKNMSNNDISGQDDDVEMKDDSEEIIAESEPNTKLATAIESQLMELRYETEKMQNTEDIDKAQDLENSSANGAGSGSSDDNNRKKIDVELDTNKAANENFKDNSHDADFDDDFDDVDINMEDLESIIDNAKDNATAVDSPMLIRDPYNLNKKPKLTGAPGMVIDLDGSNPVVPRKLTGVELLKERFSYFSKLKTPEEKERERELTIKPGMQHLKLRQELEEQISEQRSLEWAKRLEEEKQQHEEMNTLRGEDSDGDDLEKIEAKLEEKEDVVKDSSSESQEEELEEDDCDMKDKPRKKSAMIDDEAEVSEDEEAGEQANEAEGNVDDTEDADNEDEDEESEESSDESSDEEENQSKTKKGRILKAFEDSDDESSNVNDNPVGAVDSITVNHVAIVSQIVKDSQDDVIPLAQTNQSHSEDLFGSQTSINPSSTSEDTKKNSHEDCADMTTQTFSILNTNTQEPSTTDKVLSVPTNIDVICETQPVNQPSLDDVVGMCSGKFTQTQNVIPAESQLTESQCPIGEDILALCTGKFYDNQFVSQEDGPEKDTTNTEKEPIKKQEEKDLLDSILQEMDEPVEDSNRKKIIFDNGTENEAVSFDAVNHMRKKFTIDSDDESYVDAEKPAKKKKLKKRKLEKRALQISDDEDEEELLHSDEGEDFMSEVEEDNGVERIVEYDSEENEAKVKPQKQKKNRKMAEFFENEAELTSEDEWVGSGDEDERGLDRMEREEGDDDTFHQGQLQRELGQIHMRDVLDQDKREVRLIQELLFEDGDLGDGGRQRKFRWKNLDGEEEPGAVPELFAESQEEEFESEEQWRKQRHEREVFLRNLKENETEEHSISIDRSTIIKANLCSRTMSSLVMEANGRGAKVETVAVEKKVVREEPARNQPLTVFQQNYHGSLLTRGRGALARLAALAMPLAGEADDQPKPTGPSSKRNFVFAAVTPPVKEAKAPKRKADNVNIGTPRLIKKFKSDEKNDKLFPYAEEHVQKFLETEWEKEEVKEAVGALRKLALEDQENKVDGAVAIPGEDASKEEQIGGLVGSVKWQMSADRKAGPLKQLQGLIWKQGYDNGDIKGHVYDDVPAALDQWRSTDGHKVYIYSSGSVQAQKLLFGQSLAGDLLPRIDGHFDTAVGHKQEAASYTAIAEKIGAKPEEILFLTDIIEEATAALGAGLQAALVARAGNAALPAAHSLPVLHSLSQLASNKRKPPQVPTASVS
ncbi:claspin-like [Cydia splendana]|uniref:claspin-like n=1 Tax=Cydia splendana TaxID=1100963 RepID=UPI00300C5A7D